jgi:hypothetical protein
MERDKKEESKRGEYGAPAKTKFLWGKKPLSYITIPPSPW